MRLSLTAQKTCRTNKSRWHFLVINILLRAIMSRIFYLSARLKFSLSLSLSAILLLTEKFKAWRVSGTLNMYPCIRILNLQGRCSYLVNLKTLQCCSCYISTIKAITQQRWNHYIFHDFMCHLCHCTILWRRRALNPHVSFSSQATPIVIIAVWTRNSENNTDMCIIQFHLDNLYIFHRKVWLDLWYYMLKKVSNVSGITIPWINT